MHAMTLAVSVFVTRFRSSALALIVALGLATAPAAAVAQTSVAPLAVRRPAAEFAPPPYVLAGLPHNSEARTDMAGVAQRSGSRDSLLNGSLIGAAAGALALGVLGSVVCNAMREPANPSCLPDTLRIAAVGAAIGAGAGLAIDAALSRQNGVRASFSIRF